MKLVNFKYLNAQLDQTPFEHNSKRNCSFCGTQDSPQLELDASYTIITEHSEPIESACINCLIEKKYAFEHQVEGGFLTKEGILLESEKFPYLKDSSDYSENLLPKETRLVAIETSNVQDLMSTPPFSAYQGAVWLTHCNDFMTFIGNWEHNDFVAKSPDGNAQNYFDEILDNYNGDDFYEKQFSPTKSEYAQSIFYAFECSTCKIHRGYVE